MIFVIVEFHALNDVIAEPDTARGRSRSVAYSTSVLRGSANPSVLLLEKPVPELARINKTDRNQFIWWWQQCEALERCWPTKAQNQRDRWKHPDAVKRHCLADYLKILRRT